MKPCPKCQQGAVQIEDNGVIEQEMVISVHTGQPFTTPERVIAWMSCTVCDLFLKGWLEGAEFDPRSGEFVGGHFAAAQRPDWA